MVVIEGIRNKLNPLLLAYGSILDSFENTPSGVVYQPSKLWLFVHVVFCICGVLILTLSIVSKIIIGTGKYWIIYFSYWNLIINAIYFLGSLIITLRIHQKFKNHMNRFPIFSNSIASNDTFRYLNRLNNVVNICFDVLLVSNLVMIVIFFLICVGYYRTGNKKMDAYSSNRVQLDDAILIIVHSISVLLLYADAVLNVRECHIRDLFYALFLAFVYIIWSIIFSLSGLKNEYNDPYIYQILNWHTLLQSLGYCLIIVGGGTFFYFICVVINKKKILIWVQTHFSGDMSTTNPNDICEPGAVNV